MKKLTFKIKGWYEEEYEYTAGQILARIHQDARKYPYGRDWLFPLGGITKVITACRFPEEVANEIKTIILNSFTEFTPHKMGLENALMIAYCYYTAHGKEAEKAKKLFQGNCVKRVVQYDFGFVHEERKKWYDEWVEDSINHFAKYFKNDIFCWESKIAEKFNQDLDEVEAAGLFVEDFSQDMEKTKQAVAPFMKKSIFN